MPHATDPLWICMKSAADLDAPGRAKLRAWLDELERQEKAGILAPVEDTPRARLQLELWKAARAPTGWPE